jgi:hypothetical protein
MGPLVFVLAVLLGLGFEFLARRPEIMRNFSAFKLSAEYWRGWARVGELAMAVVALSALLGTFG